MKNRETSQTPQARRSQVVVTEMGQEVVLYDITEDKVHSLNPTAAFIWKQCDGSRTVAEIARNLERQFQGGDGQELVWSALDQLQRQNLLTERVAGPSKSPGLSRRRMIGKAAGAMLALPLVTTLIAPTPVMAQSGTTSAPTTVVPTTTAIPTTTVTTTTVTTTTVTTTPTP
jgi:hypothetical protein